MANRRHEEEAIKYAIRSLKAKIQTVLLTEEYLGYIASLFDQSDSVEEEAHMGGGGYDTSDGDEDSDLTANNCANLTIMCIDDLNGIHTDLANSSFINGRAIKVARGGTEN